MRPQRSAVGHDFFDSVAHDQPIAAAGAFLAKECVGQLRTFVLDATVAAFCEIEDAFDVLWPWMVAIAAMSSAGPPQ